MDTTHNNLTQHEKPIALVFNSQHDADGVLNKNKGYYRRELRDLRENGFEVVEYEVSNPRDLKPIIDQYKDNSVGLVFMRAHGEPTAMRFGANDSTGRLESTEISQHMENLPAKLRDDALIFVQSCNTGKLAGDFYNNVQFSFAKLTLSKRNVKIVAPCDFEHNGRFIAKKTNEGRLEWLWGMKPPRGKAKIAICLDSEIKDMILKVELGEKELLSNIKAKAEKSLQNGSLILEDVTDLREELISVIKNCAVDSNPLRSFDYYVKTIDQLDNEWGVDVNSTFDRWGDGTSNLLELAIYSYSSVSERSFRRTPSWGGWMITHLLEKGARVSARNPKTGMNALEFAETLDFPKGTKHQVLDRLQQYLKKEQAAN